MRGGRIAFCGTRGVPANYGGFETAVDEISQRFVAAGYEVEVICRRSHGGQGEAVHAGRSLVYVPGATNPRLETFLSSFQTGLHLWRQRRSYRHVFWFNNANFPGIMLTLLAGIPTTVNTDGLEWRRKKWRWPFKAYYFLTSALLSLLAPRLVSDSVGIQDYYRRVFRRHTFFIPYGSPPVLTIDAAEQRSLLDRHGLAPGRYFLQITRFEPDNLPLEAARAFQSSGLHAQGYSYVAVGFQQENPYSLALKALDGRAGVVVLPAIYDPSVLHALRANCACYVHGNSVGGTNPALLEAMTLCERILAVDTPFNRDVMAGQGIFFHADQIAASMTAALAAPALREFFARRSRWYNWDAVAQGYQAIVEGRSPHYDG